MFVAEGLLIIDEHDVAAAAKKFPILKAVVEQKDVAAEFLDGVTAGFDAVFVNEDNDVAQVGGEHVRFVAGGFGIEQERFAVGDNARRSAIVAKKNFVDEARGERRRFGTIAAGKNRDLATFVLENAREFFDDGRFAGAADGEVADGDDLDAEGAVAEDADAVEKAAEFNEDFENFGKSEQAGPNKVGEFAA